MVSSAILVGAFLGVKVEGSAKLLGLAEISHPEPWKVWLVLTVAILYLIIRYRFDPSTEELAKQTKEQFGLLAVPRVGRYLSRQLFLDLQSKGSSKVLENSILPDAINSLGETQVPGQVGTPKLASLALLNQHEGGIWQGRHHFHIALSVGESLRGTSSFADYRTPLHIRLPIAFYAFVRLILYSKVGINVLFPYLMGGAALIVCGWKLSAPTVVSCMQSVATWASTLL